MKLVINAKYGGFGLSKEAYEFLGLEWDRFGFASEVKRNDPRLVECVEKLGEKANGPVAELKVVQIPDDVRWVIEDYAGLEWVAEEHRVWS